MSTANPSVDPIDLHQLLAEELKLKIQQVKAVIELLATGATVPFIARYRKEKTGELDEVQIRNIEERRNYYQELSERKDTILKSIDSQGKLTDELRQQISECREKSLLEDLYLPYKPKRRTKAAIAREAGLEPLAEQILAQPIGVSDGPEDWAQAYVNAEKGVADTAAALTGAREIVGERVSEHVEVRTELRRYYAERAELQTQAVEGEQAERNKFADYFEYQESIQSIPSHRYLAIRRGETEGVLRTKLQVEADPFLRRIEEIVGLNGESPAKAQLQKAIADTFRRKLTISVETDIRVELKQKADDKAIEVFAENLENLLLAAPLGGQAVVAIDPGLRTGCKCVAVDGTGQYLASTTIYPLRGKGDLGAAERDLTAMLQKFQPRAIAVGNGTGGRETEKFVRELQRKDESLPKIPVISVSEAGASIYSASEVARDEFPDLDLTIRGAISIGRRLQDPLAELVKIDPKSIGVGQYQHDVQQTLLQRKLHDVVESCVNRVGVALNTASHSLLSYVAGVGPSIAKKIVAHRDRNGEFTSRDQLMEVSGIGPKCYEQAAGFLRVVGEHPLDNSAVHPERYELVENIAKQAGVALRDMIGRSDLVDQIDVDRWVSDDLGQSTIKDILGELRKPGRDPRKAFEAVQFRDDVNELSDLEEGMSLQGIVTNVTAFGAFVDIGVHQDGLVHLSQLSDQFVKHPSDVVKVGDRLKVRVMQVDLDRRRISLSARSSGKGGGQSGRRGGPPAQDRKPRGKSGDRPPQGGRPRQQKSRRERPERDGFGNNPFAQLLGKK